MEETGYSQQIALWLDSSHLPERINTFYIMMTSVHNSNACLLKHSKLKNNYSSAEHLNVRIQNSMVFRNMPGNLRIYRILRLLQVNVSLLSPSDLRKH